MEDLGPGPAENKRPEEARAPEADQQSGTQNVPATPSGYKVERAGTPKPGQEPETKVPVSGSPVEKDTNESAGTGEARDPALDLPVAETPPPESINPAVGQPEVGDSAGTPEQYDEKTAIDLARVFAFRQFQEIAYATGLFFAIVCSSKLVHWVITLEPIPVVDDILGVAEIFAVVVAVGLYAYYVIAAIAILYTRDLYWRTRVSLSFRKNKRQSEVQNYGSKRKGERGSGLPTPKGGIGSGGLPTPK